MKENCLYVYILSSSSSSSNIARAFRLSILGISAHTILVIVVNGWPVCGGGRRSRCGRSSSCSWRRRRTRRLRSCRRSWPEIVQLLLHRILVKVATFSLMRLLLLLRYRRWWHWRVMVQVLRLHLVSRRAASRWHCVPGPVIVVHVSRRTGRMTG